MCYFFLANATIDLSKKYNFLVKKVIRKLFWFKKKTRFFSYLTVFNRKLLKRGNGKKIDRNGNNEILIFIFKSRKWKQEKKKKVRRSS